MHVEQVLGNVPPAQRCRCQAQKEKEKPTAATETAGTGLAARLRGLFGK